MKVYLACIQYASVRRGGSHTLVDTRLLHYTLQGIQVLQGDQFKTHVSCPSSASSPITCIEITIYYGNMLKAATLLAFFGLLRASEYL